MLEESQRQPAYRMRRPAAHTERPLQRRGNQFAPPLAAGQPALHLCEWMRYSVPCIRRWALRQQLGKRAFEDRPRLWAWWLALWRWYSDDERRACPRTHESQFRHRQRQKPAPRSSPAYADSEPVFAFANVMRRGLCWLP